MYRRQGLSSTERAAYSIVYKSERELLFIFHYTLALLPTCIVDFSYVSRRYVRGVPSTYSEEVGHKYSSDKRVHMYPSNRAAKGHRTTSCHVDFYIIYFIFTYTLIQVYIQMLLAILR